MWAGVVGWLSLQTVLNWKNFLVDVNIFPNVNTDYLYIYYVHYIGYSSGFFKANLGNMMYIVKFKLLVVDIWKNCVHLLRC